MTKNQIERIAGFALVAVGILLFLVFGVLMVGSPVDVGVYAITIVPVVVGFGLIWRAGPKSA